MSRNKRATIFATSAVIVVLILGFQFLGSPTRQRLVLGDMRTVQALAGVAQQLNFAWNQSAETMPASLDKITNVVKKDALKGKPFVYYPKQKSEYELCTTFATDSQELPDTNTADPWLHPKGDYCFQLDASQQAPAAPYSYY